MIATRVRPDHTVTTSIAQRVLDLAGDPGVSLADATDHLVRMARGRSSVLEQARAELRSNRWDASAERDHALMLLRHAIDAIDGLDCRG
jgi:hypothetical protein